jgi:hypothetical protein
MDTFNHNTSSQQRTLREKFFNKLTLIRAEYRSKDSVKQRIKNLVKQATREKTL